MYLTSLDRPEELGCLRVPVLLNRDLLGSHSFVQRFENEGVALYYRQDHQWGISIMTIELHE